MAFATHGLIALCYVALALVAGLALGPGGVGAAPWVAVTVGGAVALAGAAIHQAIVGARRHRVLAAGLRRMGAAQTRLGAALAEQRDNIRRLGGTGDGEAGSLAGRGYDVVVTELQVLETLVRQLSPGTAAAETGELAEPDAAPPTPLGEVNGDEALAVVTEALQNNWVDVYLQPVVSLPQRKPAFYETFTRLRCGDGGVVEPAAYLDVAEQAGLISAIDNNLLYRCVQLVRTTQRRNLNRSFFCNISPYTMRDASFFPEFIDFMKDNGRMAANLIFEFAESDLASHDEVVARNMVRLADMGFRFSVDQVATLNLDLEQLVDWRVSFVKIEAGVLLQQLTEPEAAIAMQRMKRTLDRAGISLIAEKVEQEQQVVELLEYGIDFAQGYLFGEPRLSRDDD